MDHLLFKLVQQHELMVSYRLNLNNGLFLFLILKICQVRFNFIRISRQNYQFSFKPFMMVEFNNYAASNNWFINLTA